MGSAEQLHSLQLLLELAVRSVQPVGHPILAQRIQHLVSALCVTRRKRSASEDGDTDPAPVILRRLSSESSVGAFRFAQPAMDNFLRTDPELLTEENADRGDTNVPD